MKLLQTSALAVSLMAGNLLVSAGEVAKKTGEANRPNILFCIADDASFPHFSAYGCKWVNTPGFDRVVREGILFTNAYTPNAKCAPSRASILTGRYSWQLEEAGNHIGFWPENKYPTYCEALSRNGYFVGFTGKPWAPGDMGKIDGKERELNGKAFQNRLVTPPTKGISNDDYSGNFDDFLKEKPDGKPWCFWYGSHEPHRGYQYGSGKELGGKSIDQIANVPRFWPDNDTVRNDILDYAFEIEYFDKHLQRMLKMLEERGELDNTIVVVTSDNGMPFPRSKGFEYEYSNHMPLAIMWPKGIKKPGRKESSYISFIDLAPTFLELAGINWQSSGMAESLGKSLTDIINGSPKKDRSYILLGQERHDYGRPKNQGYPIRSIIQDGFLYVYNFKPDLWPAGNPETGYLNTDGSPTKTNILNMRRSGIDWSFWYQCFGKHPQEELYQISVDRECLVNLANTKEYGANQAKMKEKLFDNLKRQKDPRVIGNGDVFDNYPFYKKEASDYYERYMNGKKKKHQTGWVNPGDYEMGIIDLNRK